jgi:hypothetical protein
MQKFTLTCCFVLFRTWLLTLREEHRLGVFDNRVLRDTVGTKREEERRE